MRPGRSRPARRPPITTSGNPKNPVQPLPGTGPDTRHILRIKVVAAATRRPATGWPDPQSDSAGSGAAGSRIPTTVAPIPPLHSAEPCRRNCPCRPHAERGLRRLRAAAPNCSAPPRRSLQPRRRVRAVLTTDYWRRHGNSRRAVRSRSGGSSTSRRIRTRSTSTWSTCRCCRASRSSWSAAAFTPTGAGARSRAERTRLEGNRPDASGRGHHGHHEVRPADDRRSSCPARARGPAATSTSGTATSSSTRSTT